MPKIYATKYALTAGIKEHDIPLEDIHVSNDASVCIGNPASMLSYRYRKGEWFVSLELAKIQADKMRRNKIISLKKQLKKFKEMKF